MLTAAVDGLHVRFREKGSHRRLSRLSQVEGMLRFEECRCEAVISLMKHLISPQPGQEESELCTSMALGIPGSRAITKNNEQKGFKVLPLTPNLKL